MILCLLPQGFLDGRVDIQQSIAISRVRFGSIEAAALYTRIWFGCINQDLFCAIDIADQAGLRGPEQCHRADRWTLVRFDHDRSEFPLRGRHFFTPCRDCHENDQFTGIRRECIACHREDRIRADRSRTPHGMYSFDCADCHKATRW